MKILYKHYIYIIINVMAIQFLGRMNSTLLMCVNSINIGEYVQIMYTKQRKQYYCV